MSGVLDFVMSAGGLACLVLAGATWLYARPLSAGPRRFLLIVGIVYSLAAVYATPYVMGRLLGSRYRPLVASDVPAGRAAMIVLGASTDTVKDWKDNKYSTVDPAAAARVLEAVRVYRLVHPDWVISSGGLRDPARGDASGTTMRTALIELGVPADRILVETQSTTTHEEAVVIAPMLEPLHVDHVILVTSQIHMPRSAGTFRAAGINTIPAISRDPHGADRWTTLSLPSSVGLDYTGQVIHEVLGLGYYAVRGWYR